MRVSSSLSTGLLALSTFSLSVIAQQQQQRHQLPFQRQQLDVNNDDNDGFTLFRHDDHPDKQIRYKRNDGWCDGADTPSWSGYLDFEDSHLFFYYFASRDKPDEDPVLLWINGGVSSCSE